MTGVESEPHTDSRSLASALAPVLCEACDNRLNDISWFKADWQIGGAATATATYRLDNGTNAPVIIKLPVVQRELTWMKRMQPANGSDETEPVIPRLYQCGLELGGYDLAWLIIEKFEHGPLGLKWHDDHMSRVSEAATRFHAAAEQFGTGGQKPRIENWPKLVEESRESVRINELPEQQRWNTLLKTLAGKLDGIVSEWEARPITHCVHGDLHIANAMSRHSMTEGPVTLIDLAEVHPGHWVEDAVYLERQFWSRPERIVSKTNPVKLMAKCRKRMKLHVDEKDARLAMIKRVLLAGTAPHFLKNEGHPHYLEACLNWLERGLNEL